MMRVFQFNKKTGGGNLLVITIVYLIYSKRNKKKGGCGCCLILLSYLNFGDARYFSNWGTVLSRDLEIYMLCRFCSTGFVGSTFNLIFNSSIFPSDLGI